MGGASLLQGRRRHFSVCRHREGGRVRRSAKGSVSRIVGGFVFSRRYVPFVENLPYRALRPTCGGNLAGVVRSSHCGGRRSNGGHFVGDVYGFEICPPASGSFIRPTSWVCRGCHLCFGVFVLSGWRLGEL